MVSVGQRRHLVTLQTPGPSVPDGDGGFVHTWTALVPPELYVRIEPATARDLERLVSATVQSAVSHIVTGPWHPQVDTKTRLLFGERILTVAGVQNVEERNVEMILACEEVVP